MPKRIRVRDHHAEGLRRKELAAARGFRNRYEQRRAIETGKIAPIAPKRVKSKTTKRAQLVRIAESSAVGSPADRAADWSAMYARASAGRYAPYGVSAADAKLYRDKGWPVPRSAADMGITVEAYTAAYLKAFVDGPDRYDDKNRKIHRYATFYWFVTLCGYMEADEYESRYGPAR